MEETYNQLADGLISLIQQQQHEQIRRRYLIGIFGSPGSGKTSSVERLVELVNQRMSSKVCEMLPMDGYHLYKSELRQFDDPQRAFDRRGSPYTFNSEKFRKTLISVRENAFISDVYVPSFDHSVGDPVENDIVIDKNCQLVLVEGNYLGFPDISDHVWKWTSCVDLLDQLWYIDVDLEVAMNRVFRRHLGTGLDELSAQKRIDENDALNGAYIQQIAKSNQHLIHRTVQSLDYDSNKL